MPHLLIHGSFCENYRASEVMTSWQIKSVDLSDSLWCCMWNSRSKFTWDFNSKPIYTDKKGKIYINDTVLTLKNFRTLTIKHSLWWVGTTMGWNTSWITVSKQQEGSAKLAVPESAVVRLDLLQWDSIGALLGLLHGCIILLRYSFWSIQCCIKQAGGIS